MGLPPVTTTSNNRLRNCPIARSNILTNLLPAGLQDFFQVLNVSNDDDDKQAVGVFPRSNSPLGLGLDYSVANFLVPQFLAHGECKNATVCRER